MPLALPGMLAMAVKIKLGKLNVSDLKDLQDKINDLKYQVKYQKRQKDALNDKLKRIYNSNTYKFAVLLRKADTLSGVINVVKFAMPLIIKKIIKKKIESNRGKEKKVFCVSNRSRDNCMHGILQDAIKDFKIVKDVVVGRKHELSIGIITDEYMYNYYKDVFTKCIWLTPDNIMPNVEKGEIDHLLYVSCWRGGRRNEWRGHVRNGDLMSLISAATKEIRKKGGVNIFQTIEDPSNFEHFLGVAELFEVIFTTDIDCIEKYKSRFPGKKVFWGEYGVNPVHNNPLNSCDRKIIDAFFAGSYTKRYAERCMDMEVVFDSVGEKSLLIADRNYGVKEETYIYPAKYQGNVIRGFGHSDLQSVHKLAKININFNSIKYSPTMCAMRVYELQAQNTEILSNYALSISNIFPSINIVCTKRDLSRLMEGYNNLYWKKLRADSLRTILSHKTAYLQTLKILGKLKKSVEIKKHVIGVICTESLSDYFMTNSEFEVIYATDRAELEGRKIDFFGLIDLEKNTYGRWYLQDLYNSFKYSDLSVSSKSVQKDDWFRVKAGKINLDRSLVWINEKSNYKNIRDALNATTGEYLEIDRFQVNDALLFNRYYKPDTPLLSVVIPIYNNGLFLKDRCFKSLVNNSKFSSFELLLINDGSTDSETLSIIQELDVLFDNVVVYHFDSPSGTASRARNKGLELATSKYITYLDPDNAVSLNGYSFLLDKMFKYSVDAVFGYQLKIGDEVKTIGRHYKGGDVLIDNPKGNLIIDLSFPVVSTQAAVIRKDLLIDNSIEYIEGAIGQDTTFGYDVLLSAEKVAFTNDAFIEYFADRYASVTNKIGVNFFERSLKLEKEQKKRLIKYGVWQHYLNKRSRLFIEGWYLPKLAAVEGKDRALALKIMEDILEVNEIVGTDLLDGYYEQD